MRREGNMENRCTNWSIFHDEVENGLQPECNFPRVLFTSGSSILYSVEQQSAKQAGTVLFKLNPSEQEIPSKTRNQKSFRSLGMFYVTKYLSMKI
jgi:hypothetical protein